jgi:hypothetical protein
MKTASVRRGVAVALLATVAAAAEPAEPASPGSGDAKTAVGAPAVGLDSLLRLPPSAGTPAEQPRAGGATRQEWQDRFAVARGDVEAAQKAIDSAQQELGKLAQGTNAWQMSAPGGGAQAAGAENSPVSFRLRQELRKQRDELAAAERRLNELEVEANLAGVPSEWTHPPAAEPKPETPKDR